MKIATLIFKNYLETRGLKKIFWSLARNIVIRLLNDPLCSLHIHGRLLTLPLSHMLPFYLREYRFYDRLPGRISDFIHQAHGRLCGVDVGANIGDTIASFYKQESDTFLAIEPNPKFYRLLVDNWKHNSNVSVISAVCSATSEDGSFVINESNGTASIHQTDKGIKLTRSSLDDILKDYPLSRNVNVLKIDTDGHDFEVIEGSRALLSRNLPAILFECDPFGNTKFVEDCVRALTTIKQCGYSYFLLYSNFGNLIGLYRLSDLSPFLKLLFYQLTSEFYYFDILVMKDEEIFQFYKSEIDYFIEMMPDKTLQRTALTAAQS